MKFQVLHTRYLTICLFCALLFSCARQGVPTGGPKDSEPPRVDSVASTRNFATRFTERRIELKFNEWITLSDVGTQIVVSPPLVKRPEVTLKGKTVVVEFDKAEQFRPNTTYTINFGTAVKDLHEANPAKDLRFVFSTGDFIDSLTVAGNVVDAFTGDPVENVSVMLYDRLDDSVVRQERPYYFSRTAKDGRYTIQNVKGGFFKMVAIEDGDQNLKWDGENERIAFRDSALRVSDSLREFILFRLFKNGARFRLVDKNVSRYGFVKLGYSSSPDSVVIRTETPGLKFLTEKNQDTILVWYDLAAPGAWSLRAGGDTVLVKELSREDFLKNHRLGFFEAVPAGAAAGRQQRAQPALAKAPQNQPPKTVVQSAAKPAVLAFNYPIIALDTSRWLLVSDSLRLIGFSTRLDSAAPRQLKINLAWQPGKSYQLTLLPGAVTDLWGVGNADTLRRIFNVPSEKQLGGLSLTLEGLEPGARYIVQLLNGTTLEEERVFRADTAVTRIVFSKLPATTYTARLIQDANANGLWDTGNYFAHRQPEAVFTKKLDPLRANWEVEATLSARRDEGKGRRQ